jgi:ketosteroid isomerase-like protein
MASQQTTDEAALRRRIDEHIAALRAADLERVSAFYAPDIVSFDLDPPLQLTGRQAKRKRWADVFAMYRPPFGYEIHDLSITVRDGLAFGHSLNRINGTMQNGHTTAFWLRWTICLRKVDGNWLIAHEQVSVPVEPGSGRAVLDLEP